jgi:hypothetical protein
MLPSAVTSRLGQVFSAPPVRPFDAHDWSPQPTCPETGGETVVVEFGSTALQVVVAPETECIETSRPAIADTFLTLVNVE